MSTVGAWHRWHGGAPADLPALTWRGHTSSYAALEDRVRRAATLLQRWGLRPGDVIALQLPKAPVAFELHLAALATGIVTLPMSTAYTESEVAHLVDDSGCARAVRGTTDADLTALEHELTGCSPASPWPPPDPGDDALAMLCYTSGTTGRPKGARILHRNLVAAVEALHTTWRWSRDDVLVHALPVHHIHGLVVAQYGAYRAGAHACWLPRFDADAVLHELSERRATIYMGVPTHYHRLLRAPRLGPCPHMRLFTSGSAPLPATAHTAFEARTGHRILERYGMTEVGIVLSNPYEPAARRPGSVGHALPGVKVRIANSRGETLPPGEIGEVRIAGPSVFDGYHMLPERTAAALAGGEMHTGDLGSVDEDGYIHLVGRRSDLILSGGLNVYPREVERVLLTHPAVAEVAVFGLPDDDLGEAVTAAVVWRDGVGPDDLRAWCRGRLAGFRIPKRVHVVEGLPRNAMGKVVVRALRAQFGESGSGVGP